MSRGASPPGVADPDEAARWVRAMFGRIAGRYDLLNHLLSFQADRYWRARAVRRLLPVLERPGAVALDICCGSGDLTLALAGRARATVLGSDFCRPMLAEARRKAAARKARVAWFEADALRLPLRDGSLDLITAAFGFRNLADYRAGLAEMRRVLRPGGTAAILEFSQPRNPLLGRLYGFYSRRVLPAIGGWLSGSPEAYAYLPDSVGRFPGAAQLAAEMRASGFGDVSYSLLTGGIAALHVGSARAG
jgi:demethylmenaquinone methyltransferase/2-methoxy-6-polyprenyl-1,4-benzoquinol methylase